jgi:hypothetical protein
MRKMAWTTLVARHPGCHLVAAMQKHGFIPKSSTPEALVAYMKEQLGVWKTALKDAGIEPQ